MKITRHEVLIDRGSFPGKNTIISEVKRAISTVVWPRGTTKFSVNPTPKGNGVKPIKNECMIHLENCGWKTETRMQILADAKPGPLDATKDLGSNQVIAVEWETGNISSSHRAMNKMATGMLERKLIGGILILPSRSFYKFLTDRVGNYQELSPYFPMYKNLNLQVGYLSVIEIEHDEVDTKSPLIPKGTDGMANYQK